MEVVNTVGRRKAAVARVYVKPGKGTITVMKKNGFLTRDSREVERKKPGQPGARRKFQFSKR